MSTAWLKTFKASLPQAVSMADLQFITPEEQWATNPPLAAAYALAASGKFDAEDYLRRYPDVAESGIDPILHYCQNGVLENRTFKCVTPDADASTGQPKVSVVLPVYNNAHYLRECFDSVLHQTLKGIEILIIDDGSTDAEAIAIMDEYASLENRVRLIRKANGGYGHSMNVGLDNARGKYLAIVESDDYILPEMCEYYYEIAEKWQLDFVKSDFKRFFGSKERRIFEEVKLFSQDYWYGKVLNPWKDEDMREYIPKFVVIWNGLYHLEFLRENNIRFNESPGASFQDTGFFFQTFVKTHRCMTVKKSFYMLRRDNITSSIFGQAKAEVMGNEYKFIFDNLFQDNDVYNRYIKLFHRLRYDSYLFNLWRVRDEFRSNIFATYHKEYHKAKLKGELDPTWFNEKFNEVCQFADGTYNWRNLGSVELSVILPLGLDACQLHNEIRSIQQQEMKNIEIICLENGSDPDAYELVREELKEDNRIKVFYQEGETSLKDAIAYAKGEYLLLWKLGTKVNLQFFGDMLWQLNNNNADVVVAYDPGDAIPEKRLYSINDFDIYNLLDINSEMENKIFRKKKIEHSEISSALSFRDMLQNVMANTIIHGKLGMNRRKYRDV